MKKQTNFHLDEIQQAVQDAIRTGDFQKINQEISETVSGVLKEARLQMDSALSSDRRQGDERRAEKEPYDWEEGPASVPLAKPGYRPADRVAEVRAVGKVKGILCTVFGGIGLGVSGTTLLATGISVMVLGFHATGHTIALSLISLLLVISVGLLRSGNTVRGRLKRLKRYLDILDQKKYCSVENLASYTGKTEIYVRRDLRKMIELGIFPEGHMDSRETCLMLDDETYSQYLKAEEARRDRLLEEQERARKAAVETLEPGNQGGEEDTSEELAGEGRQYMDRLRALNNSIQGEVISQKLDRLEITFGKILKRVENCPREMPKIRKFMDYYLPTTLKLVGAYREFDEAAVRSENITSAKAEIEKTLDTINMALEKLLDDLYRDTVFDVTTDAAVLQTLLAKEGLTESDFKEEKPHE